MCALGRSRRCRFFSGRDRWWWSSPPVGAGERQAFQSKTTNPIATANHNPTTIQPSSYWMLPSMSCAMTSSRMLPRVWLNSHAYQNVTAIVTTRPATSTDGCKGPSSRKKVGKRQPATSGARIAVATSGE